MKNQHSIQAVDKSNFEQGFCKPLYDSYCFSRIPATILRLLTGKETGGLPGDVDSGEVYDVVLLFFLDGFGWRFFEKYASSYPVLQRFLKQGIASKITSQFPSTTAPHVTCMSSNLSVGQSGIYEWFYYEPKVDAMIAPLLFSYAGDKKIGSLKHAPIAPEAIYPARTFYQQLKEEGIASYVMQSGNIAHSEYSKVLFHGAHNVPFSSLEDGLVHLRALYAQVNSKTYFYHYFGDIDGEGHHHGIDSPEFAAAVDRYLKALEDFLAHLPASKKTACLMIADHGMAAVNPQETMYLNKELPEILPLLKKNGKGKILAPAGSCRDLFLHVEEEKLQGAKGMIERWVEGKAIVCETGDLIEQGFFGSAPVSKLFLGRVGNLVVLPFEGNAVWWLEKGRFSQHFYGAHGGLARSEMETIFLFLEV